MTILHTLGIAAALLVVGAAPPPPDGARDFTGVWSMTGPYSLEFRSESDPGGQAPFTPASRAIFDRRQKAYAAGTNEKEPPNRCRPHGVPRIMMAPYPFEIIQTPGQVTFLHEVAHNVRVVRLDGTHPVSPPLTYMGDSIGHWDGDTLVIDTVGLRDDTFIDEAGKPHSARLHVVERLRKDGEGHLRDEIRIEDPGAYTRPWTTSRLYIHDPKAPRLTEYVCEEADDFQQADR